MKTLLLLLLFSSASYAQLTAPADTLVSMPIDIARGITNGIQLLQADTAQKAGVIRAQDKLIVSMNRDLAFLQQRERVERRTLDDQTEQIRLLRANIEHYKQALKDSEPGFLAHWYVQIPIGLIGGIALVYLVLK